MVLNEAVKESSNIHLLSQLYNKINITWFFDCVWFIEWESNVSVPRPALNPFLG